MTNSILAPSTLTLESLCEYRAQIAVQRIRLDQQSGILPETVSCFSELHDYVDGNMYLIDEGHPVNKMRSFFEWPELDVDQVCRWFSRSIERVEQLLQQPESSDILAITRRFVR